MLVWIIKCENGATSVCLQVRVPRSGLKFRRQAVRRFIDDTAKERCQNYVNNGRHRHQKSTPFTEMIKESNFSSSFFLFLLSSFQKEKKKRQLLSGGMQERPNWSQPGYDRHLCFSCRMLIGGLSAILRKRKDSKKKKNKHKEQKKKLDDRRRKFQNKQEEGKKMYMLRAGQFRRQRCRSCQAFLTCLAVLVGPKPILRRQPKFIETFSF